MAVPDAQPPPQSFQRLHVPHLLDVEVAQVLRTNVAKALVSEARGKLHCRTSYRFRCCAIHTISCWSECVGAPEGIVRASM